MADSFDVAWQAHQTGDLTQAEEGYRRLLQSDPRDARVWFVLGNLLQSQDRTREALDCFRQAAELAPREPEGHFHLANALLKLGQWDEADAAYHRCLALRSNHLEALVNLGFVLAEQQKYAEAEASYRQALAIKNDVPEIHQNLGNVLRDRGQPDEAVACYRRALALRPNYAKAHVNLAAAHLALDEPAAAIEHLQRGLELEPDFAEAHNNFGMAASLLRRFDEAHAHYARAVELKPDFAAAQRNRGLLWLLQGDFERGWPAFEWRWRGPSGQSKPSYREPVWDGSRLDGRVILLYAERGVGETLSLGDALQFIRYVPLVKARGGRVVVTCQKPLLPLLAKFPGIDQLVPHGESPPKFDVQAALMSLPLILGTRAETIPADVPYLTADAQLVEAWRRRLSPLTGFRVGIVWQGNVQHHWERRRAVALESFEPLARVPGVRLISLQKEGEKVQNPKSKVQDQEEATVPDFGLGTSDFGLVSFGSQLDTKAGAFMDTAAIIANLDLVVAIDTSVAHLAGALAAPTWLALNYVADWRWLDDRDDSPWYPTMRLFRQQRPGDWPSVFQRMAEELQRLVAEAPPRPRPVAHGSSHSSSAPGAAARAPDAFDCAWQSHQAGDLKQAEEGYRLILQSEPRNARVWFVLGNLLQSQDRTSEALGCFRQAAELEPQEPEGHFHVANALLKLEQWSEADAAYRRCLGLRSNHLEALVNLGFVLGEQRKYDEAEGSYRRALTLKPDVPEIHQNLANVLRDRGQLDEAIACYRRALELRPAYAKAHVNLAVARLALSEPEAAVEHLQRGLELQPDFAEAYNTLAAAESVLRRFDEAHAHYARAVELKPDYADAHWNRALLWLLQGNFEQGWPAFEWRWRCPRGESRRSYQEPVWDGSPLDGRVILLYAEQGLGDMLHFIRYAPLVKARGGRVVVECQKPLLPLLANFPGIDQLVSQGESLPKFDVQAALMSLPLILGTRGDNIPGDVPYLAADPALTEHWRRQLAPLMGFRVGIVWQGNLRHPWDRHRSAALECFEPLASVPGVQLLSLQKGAGEERVAAPRSKIAGQGGASWQVVSFGSLVDELSGPFLDTAAIIANLDLVVAVDTAVAHLAGALAAPTWLALNYSADWRWMLNRDDSPWYPTMRLFRQQRPGEWTGVFRSIAEELDKLVTASPRRPVLIEIEPPELIERIRRLEAELVAAEPHRAHRLRAELMRLRAQAAERG